jgi:hypothetical protein
MELKYGKYSIRLEVLLLLLLAGAVLGGYVLCSCSKVSVKEGFELANAAAVNYVMGKGVPTDVYDKPYSPSQKKSNVVPQTHQLTSVSGDNLALFAKNKFSPECCPSDYSSYPGCLCRTQEQVDYINTRGGNRTTNTEF